MRRHTFVLTSELKYANISESPHWWLNRFGSNEYIDIQETDCRFCFDLSH